MGEKVKLTKASIEAITAPERGEKLVRDTELTGFGVRVSATGAKSFIVEKKVAGKTKRITLGRCDLLTVKAAREEAITALGLMAKGVVPSVEVTPEPRAVQATTLQQVLDHYLAERSRRVPPMKPKTVENYRKLVERDLKDWMQRPPGSVTEAEVVERFQAITERGPTHANNVFRTARAIFNHAIDNDAFVGADGGPALIANPIRVLKRRRLWNATRRRKRTLTPATLPAWWKIVDGLDPLDWPLRAEVIRDLWKLMLLTGMRFEEAGRILIDKLDLEEGLIVVEDSKNREDIVLPIGRYTLAMLKERAAASRKAGSKWLFPAPKREYTSPGHDIRDILMAKHDLHWSPHDLRRTFATTLESFDLSDMTIKRLMGHKTQDVTAGYVQHDMPRLRSIMQRYEDHTLQLVGVAPLPASS